MKIVVLDYSWLTPEHLDRLRAVGEVEEHRVTATIEEAAARLEGAEVAIADQWETPLTRELFEKSPSLKYLTLNSTGHEKTDSAAAKELGIAVSNAPGFSTDAVAEHTLGLALSAARHVIEADAAVRRAPFEINPANEAHDTFRGRSLRGKTWGVVGLGQIGTRVAELAQGLGMRVLAHNRSSKGIAGVEEASLERVLSESDVVSLNGAFSEDQRHLIGADELAMMREGAILVNTARAGFVDDRAVAEALNAGKLGAFATDLLSEWSPSNPVLSAPRTVVTPHIAFFTDEALEKLGDIIVRNVEAYSAGKPQNLVNA